ncbi:PKD domain-containing protein [Ferruginibacter lapsinanis]|uniref:PKD domain-containing protein n=1 Tax=Ferruginibacter lapsinanis TaxID=563172 RepID=UPI001E3CC557|nr:PKD domain-containing protein [Ferruginibacter lapsinanis]UEG49802.1 PKD domain-containing protein [Ferruginibacter lapsinanis]
MIAKIAIRACYLLFLFVFSLSTKAQLKADFSSFPQSGCSPLLVQFFDNSTGTPTQWRWDLGNGTISFLQSPSVTYFEPGQYNVKLVIKNASGSADSITKTSQITVFSKPSVDFTSNVTIGCYPLTVKFTDLSLAMSGTIVSRQWDFGDGTGSDEMNPEHIYNESGNYNVTLRETNSNGCVTTLSKSSYIKITSGVKANFTNTTPTVCGFPVTINFQNTSTGTGSLTYQWNFGDGSTSTEESPLHTYTTGGSYTVRLITTNTSGCSDTALRSNSIAVGNIKAAFSSANEACVGTPFNLQITSLGTPTSVKWDFGDGYTSTDNNPQKIYAAAGTYKIKLIAYFGACEDSAFKTVTVLPRPTATFSITGTTTSCKAPLTVTFENASIGADSYKWDFGDGTTSNQFSPSHTYTKEGKFTVSLVVTNATGCADSVKKSDAIKITMPQISVKNLPDSGCAPFSKYFSYAADEIDIWSDYTWDFGDGTTSTDAGVLHTYNDTGLYTIKLSAKTFDGCYDTVIVKNAIKVTTKPVPDFIGDREACAITPISFTDKTTGTVTKWLWEFGDGGKSEDQNPVYQYSDTGFFDVKLTVWNGGCFDTVRYNDYVYIKAPIAKFNVVSDCKKAFDRTFEDKSIGADEWRWDFGDGSTSTEQNPAHTYSAMGTYTVTLVVYNKTTGCEYLTSKEIQIVYSKANFFASDTIICKNNAVTFTVPQPDKAFVVNYEWNFGDGSTAVSTGGEIAHTYKNAGLYDVQLIITNTLGCKDTLVKTKYVQVDGPTAKFVSSVAGTCLKTIVNFSDSSYSDGIHPIEQWSWNYGDGFKETLTTPSSQHTFNVSGLYTVALKVTDSKGCTDSFAIPKPVTIAQPKAAFSSKDTLSCPGKPIQFTNLSNGISLSYIWNFGDAKTATDNNPSHLYGVDGNYDVKLLVTDMYGCKDSVTKPSYIKIVMPVSNFTMSDSFSTCPPLVVAFKDISNVFVSRKWDFGDGTFSTLSNPSHFYNYPGTYKVKLTITGPGGCIDTKEKTIEIRGPRGSFTYTPLKGCRDLKIDFDATVLDKASFIWDFSDGTVVSTNDSVISHTYKHFGEYVPKMILVDPQGCQVPIYGKDTIKVSGAAAKFSFTDKAICDSGFVSFSDSSDSYDKIINYSWDLGDGVTSIDQNATHKYSAPGSYIPKLIIKTENGCIDTAVSTLPIRVVASPKISITNFNNGCVPLVTGFSGNLLAADTSVLRWEWDFGNGSTSNLQTPLKQTYSVANDYMVNLKVTNSSGCFDTAIRKVEAYPIPVVNAGEDAWVCLGKNYKLKATGASTYSWNYNKTLNCLDCADPTATPTGAETRYNVTGTTEHGCVASDEVILKVQNPFKVTVSKTDTLCKGSSVEIAASGADNYLWIPSTGLKSVTDAKTIATPDTTTIYKVIGSDARGCFQDTGSVRIKVYPIPTVELGENKVVNVGQTITLNPAISKDVTQVIWTPQSFIVSGPNSLPDITLKPKQTTEYTLEVKNPGGCKSTDKVTVFVICNGANIFMPNTFSPNGDGANDVYYPRGTGIFSIKTLRIFGRWGELVYERSNFKANDATAAWDGTYKGIKLTPDVYVYTMDVLCENNEVIPFKGNIALIQ